LTPLLLAFALLGNAGAAPEPAPAAAVRESAGDGLLREARSLRYAQRWFEAAARYRKFLADNPGSPRVPEARFWLAATLESDQRWDEAIDAYTDFLDRHPDQRLLGKEARLNRVRCWGVRQFGSQKAVEGLRAALVDPTVDVQVAAALQLSKAGNPLCVEALRKGLDMPGTADACSMALISLGVKPQAPHASQQANRFLVIRIREAGKPDTVTIRLALALARATVNYLSDAQVRQARAKGIDLEGITEQALSAPKGSVLFSVDDTKSTIEVTVE
jgi:tetratricopeptide (TPR) repeat protein